MRVIQVAQFGGPEVLTPGEAPDPAAAHTAMEARRVIGKSLLLILMGAARASASARATRRGRARGRGPPPAVTGHHPGRATGTGYHASGSPACR